MTHSFARSTGPGGLAAEIVLVEQAQFAGARGKIALVDGLATPVTILQASQAGCAGIVFANEDRFIHNMIGTTIWGTPELDQLDRMPTVAAVSVDLDSGIALKAMLAAGQPVQAVMTTLVETGWYRSKLPEVRIAGSREPERFVLVGGHYCAWHEGITDNATGDACVLEMAKLLWRERASLERSVRLCWWPGHSHGRYSGSTWYADTFFNDLAEGGLAYYNIDSPGVKGATAYYCRNTCAEFDGYCRSVIASVTGQTNAPVFRPMRAADQSFLASGMPSFSAYPFLPDGHPDKRPWTGGCGNAWWWHTEHDTLDKADVSILATDVKVGLEAVWGLANATFLPLDYRATVKELLDVVTGFQAKAEGVDFEPLLADARLLADALDRFEARRTAPNPRARRCGAVERDRHPAGPHPQPGDVHARRPLPSRSRRNGRRFSAPRSASPARPEQGRGPAAALGPPRAGLPEGAADARVEPHASRGPGRHARGGIAAVVRLARVVVCPSPWRDQQLRLDG